MDLAVSAILGISDPTGRILVRPGLLHQPAILARAHANARATVPGPDGLAWDERLADTPRFSGPAGRLLIEGQRVNMVRNPRAEGAVPGIVGSGGGLPSGWARNNVPELTLTVIGAVTVDGLPGLRVRISGTTAVGGGWALIEFENAANIPAAPNQSWLGSVFWRIAEGSLPAGTQTRAQISGRTSSNAVVSGNDFSGSAPLTASLSRAVVAASLTNDATIARVNHRAVWNFPASTAVDLTVDLCAPQIEQGAFASTPILPPIGTPGASTRGGDIVSAPLAALGIGGNGACTVLWSGVIPNPAPGAPALASHFIACLDNGTEASRFFLANLFGGSSIAVGANNNFPTIGTMVPGTPFRAGCTIDGAGRIAGSFNGNAVVAQTGGPTAGLTTFRVGGGPNGGNAMFGETTLMRVLPYALPDAALPGAVAALPGG